MGVENEFRELSAAFGDLRDRFQALQIMVLEDKPLKGATLLVDQLGYTILDVRGLIEESYAALSEADSAARFASAREGTGWRQANAKLADCHERFLEADRRYRTELVSYDRISDLTSFGREKRGEWLPWATGVRETAEACHHPIDRVGLGLLRCWSGLAGRSTPNLVAVRAADLRTAEVVGVG